MPNESESYALITGASSGIGYELTKQFAKNGYNMVIVARSQDRLDEIARDWTSKYGVKVMPLAKDLFDPAAPQEIYDEVKRWGIQVNALVNDAGQGVYGFFHETDLQKELDIIQLNITAMVSLTKLFIKDMVANKDGKILNLASMVSKMPSPLMAVYSATKAFIYNFSESLVNELENTGVTITALLPGATATDFFHKANAENTVTYQDGDLSDPEDVAADGYSAMMSGHSRIISGFRNKLSMMMSNLTPDSALAGSMRRQMDEKKPDEDVTDHDNNQQQNDQNNQQANTQQNNQNNPQANAQQPNNQNAQPIANIQITAQPAGNGNQINVQPMPADQNNNGNNNTNQDQAVDNDNNQAYKQAAGANRLPAETRQPGDQLPMEIDNQPTEPGKNNNAPENDRQEQDNTNNR
jgi:uncharacterized protein